MLFRSKATVVEVSYNTYLLFSTKNILETQTNYFKDIKLLHNISENSLNIISMGIGYGDTVQDAKYNATLGMEKPKVFISLNVFVNAFLKPAKCVPPSGVVILLTKL